MPAYTGWRCLICMKKRAAVAGGARVEMHAR
jgi:hypothetical protein